MIPDTQFCYNNNPTSDGLRECLDNPEHLINSSWAADLSFQFWRFTAWQRSGIACFQTPVSYCMSKGEWRTLSSALSPPIAITVIQCDDIRRLLLFARSLDYSSRISRFSMSISWAIQSTS